MPDNKQSFFPSLLAKAEQNAQNILTGYWVDRHPLKQSRLQALCCFRLLSRVWLFNTMNCSTPGSPVFHCLPEFAQTHVHWVSDAIQPSHPLSPPSPLAPRYSFFKKHVFIWLHLVLAPAFGIFIATCGVYCCGARAPEWMGSVVVARRLSCSVACGILVPQPGMEPSLPALEGGVLTTGSPGNSPTMGFLRWKPIMCWEEVALAALRSSWSQLEVERQFHLEGTVHMKTGWRESLCLGMTGCHWMEQNYQHWERESDEKRKLLTDEKQWTE